MADKTKPKVVNSSQIEQAAELWVNLVIEQIKHNRRLEKTPDYLPLYKTDKNEKLYNRA